MGLLLPHKSTITVYSDMVTVSEKKEHKASGGGKRGDIENFSADARYRLFRLLHSIEFERVTFITLTYPAEFPTNPKIYKGHLREFRRRFERKFGAVRAVWRLEFQERGAPHFHIMYLDCQFIPIGTLSLMWHKVIKSKDENHLKNGVDLKLIVGNSEKRLIASYIGKYISKVDKGVQSDNENKVGRYYGRWNITEETPYTFEIPSGQTFAFVRYALMCSGGSTLWEPGDTNQCTVFGSSMGDRKFGVKMVEYEGMLRSSNRK